MYLLKIQNKFINSKIKILTDYQDEYSDVLVRINLFFLLDDTFHNLITICTTWSTIEPNNTRSVIRMYWFDSFFYQKPVLWFCFVYSDYFFTFFYFTFSYISIVNWSRINSSNQFLTEKMVCHFVSIVLVIVCDIDEDDVHY